MKSLTKILTTLTLSILLSISITSAQSCSPFTVPMSVGSRDSSTGGQVTRLQSYLYNMGLLPVEPTGYFGTMTRDAVMKYQASKGFDTVGNVGPLTRQSLSIDTCNTNNSNSNLNTAVNNNNTVNTNTNYSNNTTVPVSFTSLDETVTLNIPYGSLLNLPTLQTRSKYPTYTFNGWYTDSNYTNQYLNSPVTFSVNLYAKWTKSCTTGTVVFPNDCNNTNTNTNDTIQSKTCLVNGISIPVAVTFDCSQFGGTNTNTNNTNNNTNGGVKYCLLDGKTVIPAENSLDCMTAAYMISPSNNPSEYYRDKRGTQVAVPFTGGQVRKCTLDFSNSLESLTMTEYTDLGVTCQQYFSGYHESNIKSSVVSVAEIPSSFVRRAPASQSNSDTYYTDTLNWPGVKICTLGSMTVKVPSNFNCPESNNSAYSGYQTVLNDNNFAVCVWGGLMYRANKTHLPNGKCPKPTSENRWTLDLQSKVTMGIVLNSVGQLGHTRAEPMDLYGVPRIAEYLPVVVGDAVTILTQVSSKTLDGYYFDGIYSDFYYKNKFSDTLNSSVLSAIQGSGNYGIQDGQLYVKWSKNCSNGKKIFFPETCNTGTYARIYGEGRALTIRWTDTSSSRNLDKIPRGAPNGYYFGGYFRDANYTNLLSINNVYYLVTGDVLYIKWIQNCSNGTTVVYPSKCSSEGTAPAPTVDYQTISFKNNGSSRDINQYKLNSGHSEEVNIIQFSFNDGGKYTYYSIVNQADGKEYAYRSTYFGESLNGILQVPIQRDLPAGTYVLKAGLATNGYVSSYVYSDPFKLVTPQDNPDQYYLNFKTSNSGSRNIKKIAGGSRNLVIAIPEELKVPIGGRKWVVNRDVENEYISINSTTCDAQGCAFPQGMGTSRETHVIDGVIMTTNDAQYAIRADIPIPSDMPAGNYVLRICTSSASLYCQKPWYESDVFQISNPVASTGNTGSVLGVSAYQFERELSLGSRGEDVLNLQKMLNLFGFNVEETGYFGEMTKESLKKFQEEKGLHILLPLWISEGTGVFGKSTMNYVNNLFINFAE